jgi:hypothetical protein
MAAKPGAVTHESLPQKIRSFVSEVRRFDHFALVSLLTLSTCVQPAAQSASVDGDYRGTTTRVQVLSRTCPHPSPQLSLHVQAGITYYLWNNAYVTVSVLSNGTLSGAGPGVQITGTHDGSTMQGDVTDGQCTMHFTLKKLTG